MAFMGVLLVIIVIVSALGVVFFLGMLPIIVGTILIKKTTHKRMGVVLRIFGYIVILPILTFSIIMIWWFLLR